MARILVIEDEADMRAVLEETLKTAGYEVTLAADGSEGLKQYRAAPADLVITDLFMPNQDGLETIKYLRREFPGTRIIAMCGRSAASAMLSIAQYEGAKGILEKPFLPDELLVAVEAALRAAPHT